MPKAHSVRHQKMEGSSVAVAPRKLAVSSNTAYKCLAMEGLPQKPPAPRGRMGGRPLWDERASTMRKSRP